MSKSVITKSQDTGTNLAKKIIITIDKQLDNEYYRVYVCNNGNDTIPTWEDCTEATINKEYYSFVNTTKTSEIGAIMVKVMLDYNNVLNINLTTSSDYLFNINYIILDNEGMSVINKITLKDFILEPTNKLWYEYELVDANECESITNEVVVI